MVHSLGNEKEKAIVDKLKSEGKTVYSISRINTKNTCDYEYYKTYVERDRGENNVYSEIGTFAHEYIEKVYRGEIEDTSNFKRKFNMEMFKLEMKDMKFPNEKIEHSFRRDIEHFTENFSKLEGEFELEKMYIAEINGHYFYGYIDAIRNLENKLSVIDWKTSSKFSGDKLTHAGRQLIVYKIGLEQQGLKIDKVYWNMLKYCYICNVQKNKKVKRKMVNRGKLIKEMRTNFTKLMIDSDIPDFEIDVILNKAEENNDFNSLPQCIKDVYWIEDCMLEYEVTNDKIEEVKNYITSTIEDIESMDKQDASQWKPLNIEKESFYCNTLCGHRNSCEYLKKYKKENPFKKIGF